MNYQARIEKLRQILPCECLLIEHPTHIFYLTGIEVSVGKLLITQKQADLIVDGRYFTAVQNQKIVQVHLLDKMSIKEWLSNHGIKIFGVDAEKTSYQAFINLQKMCENVTLLPIETSLVQKLRMVKDADEIAVLKQAAALCREGSHFVISSLQEDVTEEEIALELEFFWKKQGAKKLAFDPIIAFGSNSAMPHYHCGSTRLKKNMAVLLDIGVVWNFYNSDMTRMTFFGEPPGKIKEICSIVEEAKSMALELCKPGTLVGDLDRVARDHISSKGYGEFFTHGLGHGLGLDIHEPPILRSKGIYSELPLESGMVITIEPGIYLPGIGGVRLEDTICITKDGYENITA